MKQKSFEGMNSVEIRKLAKVNGWTLDYPTIVVIGDPSTKDGTKFYPVLFAQEAADMPRLQIPISQSGLKRPKLAAAAQRLLGWDDDSVLITIFNVREDKLDLIKPGEFLNDTEIGVWVCNEPQYDGQKPIEVQGKGIMLDKDNNPIYRSTYLADLNSPERWSGFGTFEVKGWSAEQGESVMQPAGISSDVLG